MSETSGLIVKIKVFKTPPTVNLCPHQYRSAAKMTSTFETTCTLRYELRSREIYIDASLTSPEILSEPPQTQDDSVNTIQETPNSQFRLFLSVTPCMPRTNSLECINRRHSPSPPLFSPTPSPAHVPTHNSPQEPATSPPPLCRNPSIADTFGD